MAARPTARRTSSGRRAAITNRSWSITAGPPSASSSPPTTAFPGRAAPSARSSRSSGSPGPGLAPAWIELLIKPVLDQGYEYVAPYYLRHKYDGTITNTIVYPMTRALYGKRVRQPIGGDFGFSGRLASLFLDKDVWEGDVARFGIDIWMTTTALANGFRVCQAFLGAKIHDAKDPGSDLSAMLHQVVGSVFDLMEEYAAAWHQVRGSEPVATIGFPYSVGLE